MSFIKNYTTDDLSKFEKVETFKNGPFNIDDWITYTKKNPKRVGLEFMDKQLILIKYPRLVDITEEVVKYKTDDKYVYDITYHVKKLVPTGIAERRNLKPFGEAAKGNRNVTRVGEEIFIEYLNDESWRNKKITKNEDENISKADSGFTTTGKGGFKLFKSSSRTIRKMSTMENTYMPPSDDRGRMRSNTYSIVIKNIPNDMEVNDAKNQLLDIFNNFAYDSNIHKNVQSICTVNILTNNDNIIKGIAFVDFYNEESCNKVLNSNSKFKLGFNVLTIEQKKSRR